jgi:acyl-coenzyme A thioesterase PaaI-like protein
VTAFDEATAVTKVADGCYHMCPDQRFALVAGDGTAGAVNGGVLLAAMLRAVLDCSPHPYPVVTSAHFLRVAAPRPAQVRVAWLKRGKTAATARATLIQDGSAVLETTVTTGGLDGPAGGDDLAWSAAPPVLPPIGDCLALARPGHPGFAGQVDLRLDPATAGWLRGRPAGTPQMRGYFSLREDRPPDACLLALAVDALPPVIFGLTRVGWSPTVELTWHMRAVPAPGPLRVVTRCRRVGGGWFDEEAEVWDEAGQLAAQSRQIARVGRGRPWAGA